MRRDWTPWNPQKVSKISMFLAIFTYDGCSPTPSNAQVAVLEPFESHLEPFWCHFGVILGPSGRHAARLDALEPSKSIEHIDDFSDFYV